MPLGERQLEALGCMLFWPGLLLGGMAGAGVLMSGLVPRALLDAAPIVGLVIILGCAVGGVMLMGLLVLTLKGEFQPGSAGKVPPEARAAGPRKVELPNVRHNRPPTPEDWGYRDHDDRD